MFASREFVVVLVDLVLVCSGFGFFVGWAVFDFGF